MGYSQGVADLLYADLYLWIIRRDFWLQACLRSLLDQAALDCARVAKVLNVISPDAVVVFEGCL